MPRRVGATKSCLYCDIEDISFSSCNPCKATINRLAQNIRIINSLAIEAVTVGYLDVIDRRGSQVSSNVASTFRGTFAVAMQCATIGLVSIVVPNNNRNRYSITRGTPQHGQGTFVSSEM